MKIKLWYVLRGADKNWDDDRDQLLEKVKEFSYLDCIITKYRRYAS